MRRIWRFLAVSAVAIGLASSARAAIVDLTFEGIGGPSYPFGVTRIQDFYNGGVSEAGASGPDYGVTFTGRGGGIVAVCLDSLSVTCSRISKGGLGPADSREGALDYLHSFNPAFIDVASGFTGALSFDFVTSFFNAGLSVWSGLDGTGVLLATIALPASTSGCPDFGASELCPFAPASVPFSSVAHSIQFTGNGVDLDDVTFSTAPEPSTWAMMLIGFAGLGYAALRRKAAVRTPSM